MAGLGAIHAARRDVIAQTGGAVLFVPSTEAARRVLGGTPYTGTIGVDGVPSGNLGLFGVDDAIAIAIIGAIAAVGTKAIDAIWIAPEQRKAAEAYARAKAIEAAIKNKEIETTKTTTYVALAVAVGIMLI